MKLQASSPEACELLLRGSLALARVEAAGIRVDMEYLERTIKESESKVKELEGELYQSKVWKKWKKHFGNKADLASPQQLGIVVYDLLGFECEERSEKTQRPKVDEKALTKVDHPFVKKYQELIKTKNLTSKFLKGLRRETVDGYFHPSYNLHTTSTFRSSSGADKESAATSREYNLQNIPIRDPEKAKLIRSCFVPRKSRHLVEVDFSGIEVRTSACINKDPVLIKYLKDPTTDMHRDTACQLFFLRPNQVDKKTTRDWSKNRFVFPQFYGSVYFQCAPHLWEVASDEKYKLPNSEVSIKTHLAKHGIKKLGLCQPGIDPVAGTFEAHVKSVENDFWNKRFIVYTEWKKKVWSDYLREGGLTTLTGFRINGVLKRNEVLDYDAQGSAFHCLLWCLTRIVNWFTKNKMKTYVVGQVHDSILLDAHPKELQDVLNKAHEVMTIDLVNHWEWAQTVPFETETDVSPTEMSWYLKEQWEKLGGIWKLKPKK